MKHIILLLELLIFIPYISCNEDLLSKFHQHDYKLKDVRLQLMSYNRKYLNFYEMKAFKYNRTTTAHNSTINMKVDASDKLEVLVQVYKFLSNEYRYFPIRYQVNLKKAFKANVIGLQESLKCGNFTGIDFHKDVTYHVCNFVVDESHLPPLIPTGKFLVEMTFLLGNEEIAMSHGYGEVYTPMVYP